MEPHNIVKPKEIERLEIYGWVEKGQNGEGSETVEEQPENIDDRASWRYMLMVCHSAAESASGMYIPYSSISSVSSSEYSLASDKDN